MKTVIEFVAILSSPSGFLPACTPDFRTQRLRRLSPHVHSSHFTEKFVRSGRWNKFRKFATKSVGEATMLPDKQFNQLVAALAAIKKLTT